MWRDLKKNLVITDSDEMVQKKYRHHRFKIQPIEEILCKLFKHANREQKKNDILREKNSLSSRLLSNWAFPEENTLKNLDVVIHFFEQF